jgi:hypothetical protein
MTQLVEYETGSERCLKVNQILAAVAGLPLDYVDELCAIPESIRLNHQPTADLTV